MRMLAAVLAGAIVVTGCSAIPRDPDHTLERIRSERVLRLGVSPNPPWTTVNETSADDAQGTEVELVRDFATRQGARVEIVVAGEESLVKRLEQGQIDVMVGGLTSSNRWSSKIGATRAYARTSDARGKTEKHIMAVPLGENRLLSELERHLDATTGRLR